MSNFGLAFTLLLLRMGMTFVPEQPYKEKVENITPMEEKNRETDLGPWRYRQLKSPRDGFVHRYYHLPSKKPNAPVMLFIHGLNLDARTFLNLDALADEWELIAYDLPEKTRRYQGKHEDFTNIVSEFLDLKQIRRVSVVGVSFGGGIALELAAVRQDLDLQSLILISTAISERTESQRKSGMRISSWLTRQPDYKIYWFIENLYKRTGREFKSGNGEENVEDILRVKHPDFYRQVGQAVSIHDPRISARYVKAPTLLLIGTEDRLFSPDQAINVKKYIPQTVFRAVKGGTHAMTLNRPEEISNHILRFSAEEKVLERERQQASY